MVTLSMEKRTLGRTGAEVSVLGYGAMELRGQRGGPTIDDEDAGRLLNQVLDSGIDLIDTSIDYGRSEELIGRYISHRRDEYFLASKCGCPLEFGAEGGPSRPPHDYRPENILAGTDQSLRRLDTDRIDLVQVHGSPSATEMESAGTIATLLSLRDEGKIRFIGMSGTLPNLPDHIAMGVFDVFQIPYSAVQREHEAQVTAAAEAGAGTLIRGGVARGVEPDGEHLRNPIGLGPGEGQRRWEESGIAELIGDMSPLEFMLRFTISHPDVSTTIVGTANPDHLRSNVAITEKGPLPSDLYEEAKRRFPDHHPE